MALIRGYRAKVAEIESIFLTCKTKEKSLKEMQRRVLNKIEMCWPFSKNAFVQKWLYFLKYLPFIKSSKYVSIPLETLVNETEADVQKIMDILAIIISENIKDMKNMQDILELISAMDREFFEMVSEMNMIQRPYMAMALKKEFSCLQYAC